MATVRLPVFLKTLRCVAILVTLVAAADETALGQSLEWATRAGGTMRAQGTEIAVDSIGNSYVTGYFVSTITFGPGEPTQTTLVTGASFFPWAMFVAKYDPAGRFLWARQGDGG